MYKRRLDYLAQIAESIPAEKFCVNDWLTSNEPDEPEYGPGFVIVNASADNRYYIGLEIVDNKITYNEEHYDFFNVETQDTEFTYTTHTGWRALQMYYDVDSSTAYMLFSPRAYPDRKAQSVKTEFIRRVRCVIDDTHPTILDV